MRVLVTGSSGFIGRHLVDSLLSRGETVIAFSRKEFQTDAEIFVGDILDKKRVSDAISGADLVVHVAGVLGNTGTSDRDMIKVNVEGTRNVSEACQKQNIKMIHFSSTGVFGTSFDKLIPTNDYEKSKLEGEKIAVSVANAVVVRPGLVYGPGDRSNIRKLFMAIKNKRFVIVGDGKNRTCPIYIDDLIQGVLLVIDKGGGAYNIAGSPVSLETFVTTIAKGVGETILPFKVPYFVVKPVALLFDIPSKLGFVVPLNSQRLSFVVSERVYDSSRIKKELGFMPKTSLIEGIKETVRWYKSEGLL